MMHTLNLIPTPLPQWLDYDGQTCATEFMPPEALAALGWLPLIRDTEDAPLGYADPVQEVRDGQAVAVQYALGTLEEREAETLRLWREGMAVNAWQARYIMAATPRVETAALAAIPGDTLLAQVDALVSSVLPAPALEKFRGALTWRRSDPMLSYLVSLAGLDDEAIDVWFRAAAEVQ